MPAAPRHTFPPSHRLGGKLEFSAVFDQGKKDARGPLVCYSKPNTLGHPRLGISIGRRVGIAAKRNRIKRLLRESFRLMQHDLPTGYDLVLVVRPHNTLILAEYQRLLSHLAAKAHRNWTEKPSPQP